MKKKISVIVILAFLILLFIFLFPFKKDYKKANIKFLNEDDINLKIDNSSPISDDLGKKLDIGNLEFSIKSYNMNVNSTKYELYIKQINNINSINSNYIKLYLAEKTTDRPFTKKPLVFSNLKISETNINSRVLYVGSIGKNQTIGFRLRMWLSDNYTVSNANKSFEIKIGVRPIN